MRRRQKLTVLDEIDNALTYYTSTFLTAIPRLYQDLSIRLQPPGRTLFEVNTQPLPPFLQMGSWIGGDRDGNPKVDASTLEQDRKSVVSGQSVSVRVDLGGRRIIQNKTQKINTAQRY